MRMRLTAPRGARVSLSFLDSLHGALVNAWTACGAHSGEVIGRDAGNWSFGAVGTATRRGFLLKSLVVGAEGGPLEPMLRHLSPEVVRKTSANGDVVDLAGWDSVVEQLPAVGEPESVTVPAGDYAVAACSFRAWSGRALASRSLAGRTRVGGGGELPSVTLDRPRCDADRRA